MIIGATKGLIYNIMNKIPHRSKGEHMICYITNDNWQSSYWPAICKPKDDTIFSHQN